MALAFVPCCSTSRFIGTDATSRASIIRDALQASKEHVGQLLFGADYSRVIQDLKLSEASLVSVVQRDALSTMIRNAGCTATSDSFDGVDARLTASDLFQAALLSSSGASGPSTVRYCNSQLPFAIQRGDKGALVDSYHCFVLLPSSSQLLYESLRLAPSVEVRDVASVDALRVTGSPLFFTSYTSDWKRCSPHVSRFAGFTSSLSQAVETAASGKSICTPESSDSLKSRSVKHGRRLSKILCNCEELSLTSSDVDFIQRLRNLHTEVYGTLDARYYGSLSDFITLSENTGKSLCHGLSEWDALSIVFGFISSSKYGLYSVNVSYGQYVQHVFVVLPLNSCLVECSGCVFDQLTSENFVFSNIWIERFAMDESARPMADSDSLESAKRYLELTACAPMRVFCSSFYRITVGGGPAEREGEGCAVDGSAEDGIGQEKDAVQRSTDDGRSIADDNVEASKEGERSKVDVGARKEGVQFEDTKPQGNAGASNTRIVRRRPIR